MNQILDCLCPYHESEGGLGSGGDPPETGASIRLGWAAHSYNMDSVTQVMDSVTQVMCPYHESEGGLGSSRDPP